MTRPWPGATDLPPLLSFAAAPTRGWVGRPVVVWLNGTRGAGKATTAGELVELVAEARAFDAVEVG